MNILFTCLLIGLFVSVSFYMFTKNETDNSEKKNQEMITLLFITSISAFVVFSCFYKSKVQSGGGVKSLHSTGSGEVSLSHSVKAPF